MNSQDRRPKTIFCDIDGTLIKHLPPDKIAQERNTRVLQGTIDKLIEWDRKGYNIILVTGRKESLREITIKQLQQYGIIYDKLIMGIGGGARILINDCKPDGTESAYAINLQRNIGIKDIDI